MFGLDPGVFVFHGLAGRAEGVKHAEDVGTRKNEALNMAADKLKAEKKAHKELQDKYTVQGNMLEKSTKLLTEAQAHVKRLKREATKAKVGAG